jgi:hypothetical protein
MTSDVQPLTREDEAALSRLLRLVLVAAERGAQTEAEADAIRELAAILRRADA